MFYSFRSHFISLNFSNNFSLTPFTRRFVSFLCSLHLIWTQWKVDAMVEKSIYGNLGRLNFLRLFLPANLNRRSISLANFWSTAATEVVLKVNCINHVSQSKTYDRQLYLRNASKICFKNFALDSPLVNKKLGISDKFLSEYASTLFLDWYRGFYHPKRSINLDRIEF